MNNGNVLFHAELQLKDDSKIFIKEYVFKNNERKYAYHWTDVSGNLICRWDNASHWPDVATFPHHKHIDNDVKESTETSFSDVLESVIQKRFQGR
ncbi:MAG: DUF6516 family protein [Thermodesulfobacteriota bacterium]|nr:DUF6516 family protein [Thermodesulfobacteriota bacterium]